MFDEIIYEGFVKYWSEHEQSGLWKTLSKKERSESKRAAWCAWKAAIEMVERHLTSRRSRAAAACANCEWRPTKPGWKCLTTDCEYYPPPA